LATVASKAQHQRGYAPVPSFLRQAREEAGLTQRQIGLILGRPQSWVYNCETANRRVDVAEFCRWCLACGVPPVNAIRRLGFNEK
jgi:transcriptional regulator with XRE-family HTH domain